MSDQASKTNGTAGATARVRIAIDGLAVDPQNGQALGLTGVVVTHGEHQGKRVVLPKKKTERSLWEKLAGEPTGKITVVVLAEQGEHLVVARKVVLDRADRSRKAALAKLAS